MVSIILFSLSFANNWAWALIIIPLLMLVYRIRYEANGQSSLLFSTTNTLWNNVSYKVKLRQRLTYLPILAVCFLIIAIARPQSDASNHKSNVQGIDIMLAIDISNSMLAPDFEPNRLVAAQRVASDFIEKRPNDRIGLVVFSGESFTQCPPTVDHDILQKQLFNIKNGILEDGTAIGMGLATSVMALQHSKANSKIVILLTDGVNTAGIIDPNTAVDVAKAMNVKVYCIGIGTKQEGILGIDEPLMTSIAKNTGGKYFYAGNTAQLEKIYAEIDKMETVEIAKDKLVVRTEEYLFFALAGFIVYLLYFVLRYIILRGVV